MPKETPNFKNTWCLTLSLLRSALGDGNPPKDCKGLPPQTLRAIYTLSTKHDLAHLIAVPLIRDETIEKDSLAPFQSAMYRAVMRYEQMHYEMEQMAALFNREKIPYLPLKGAVMREYYPEPWMRTSCDIDVLIHEFDLNRAIECMEAALHYRRGYRSAHDVSLSAQNRIQIELHYETIEINRARKSNAVLSNIWNHASPTGESCRYVLDDDMFAFYHIAHMAKHFENGGCGVRPFLDLWLLNHRIADKFARDELLEKGGLLKFAEACDRLSEVWFGEGKPDDITDALQNYILCGGLYGSVENMIAVQQNQDGGRIRYILRRLFLPYDRIKNLYPVLQKHKWLTPVMEVRRWIKMITDGRMNRTIQELQYLNLYSENNDVTALLKLLEL